MAPARRAVARLGKRGTVAAALVLAVVLGAAAAGAQGVRREQLPNGMTVIVRESPATPVVALSLLVRIGSRWERPEEAGISNFVHAVMVKGTAQHTGAELAEAVAALGGKITAAGDVDYSGINAQALARFWRELLGLAAELALRPRMTVEDVDLERDWLLSRIQRRNDNPSSRAFDEFYAAVYGGHPYGRPVLGTPETLRRIQAPALLDLYRASYAPERMVLVVSGQVKGDEVMAEARRLFAGLPRGGGAMPPANPAPQPARRRVVVEQPAQQAQILAGGLAPALDHPDHAAVKVLSAVLGGGMAGRLFAELRDKQALAYTAASYYDPVKEPGILTLYLGTAPENAERAEAALLKEIERIRRDPVTADELARAKGYLLGTYAMDRRTNARQAWYLGFYEIEGVGLDYPERYRQAVSAVTAADVQRVARAYLAAPTLVILRPPGR
jgi:predicted Zn-dependent peptidase